MWPLPKNSTRLGPAVHPMDNDPSTAIRLSSGVEVLYCAGSIRTLPRDWRKHQPSDGDPVANFIDRCQCTAVTSAQH